MSWRARVVILPGGTLPACAGAGKAPGSGERGLPHAPVAPGAASCQPGATPHALLVPKLCLGTPLRTEAVLRTAGVSAGGRRRVAPACPADTPSLRSPASPPCAFPSKARGTSGNHSPVSHRPFHGEKRGAHAPAEEEEGNREVGGAGEPCCLRRPRRRLVTRMRSVILPGGISGFAGGVEVSGEGAGNSMARPHTNLPIPLVLLGGRVRSPFSHGGRLSCSPFARPPILLSLTSSMPPLLPSLLPSQSHKKALQRIEKRLHPFTQHRRAFPQPRHFPPEP